MKITNNIFRSVIIVLSLTVFFVYAHAQAPAWQVPAKYTSMKSPLPANKDNLANGKDLYKKNCNSCHGSAGLGDGPKAATLDASCGDFSTAKFQGQSDGTLFFMMSEGKGKMPAFKKTIPEDNDRWAIVQYLRTFKGK